MAFFKREFFKRELDPIERFENALKEKLAARQKLAERLSVAETELAEKRAAAERLAVAGAATARLDRAEAAMRAVEERTKTWRAALVEFDEQVASAERALADAKAQRDRDTMADQIEAMAAAIERAAPGFDASATALVEAVTKAAMSIPDATRFSSNVDAVRREVLAAADLICWELRSAAVRTRAGNANLSSLTLSEFGAAVIAGDRTAIDLHPPSLALARGRRGAQGSGLYPGRAAQSAAAGSAAASACGPSQRPPCADPDASSRQRRAQGEPERDDPQLVDLDALLAEETAERASRRCVSQANGAESSSAGNVRHSQQGSPGNRVAATPPFCDRNVHEAGHAVRSEAWPLQLETSVKSESTKRNVVSENDPAIRNPFGVMDVPNPNDDDVTQFARNTAPEESATDENAKPWSAGDTSYPHGTIEGRVVEPLERCCGPHHTGRCPR